MQEHNHFRFFTFAVVNKRIVDDIVIKVNSNYSHVDELHREICYIKTRPSHLLICNSFATTVDSFILFFPIAIKSNVSTKTI